MRLLVHCCCAPDATAIARLAGDFAVSTYFYNPNIHPIEEYDLRLAEMEKVHQNLGIDGIEAPYDPERWMEFVKGHESDLEKGERCRMCYAMRLRETARIAKEKGFDAFTTVLSASPHKVTNWIMEEGEKASQAEGIPFLARDFKQKDGYLETLKLSSQWDIYRQDYCGCLYSIWQRKEEEAVRKEYRERLSKRLREDVPAFMLRLHVERDGAILLVPKGDRLEMPSGYLNPGEKIRNALKRIATENGFEVANLAPGEVAEVLQPPHRIIQTYLAECRGVRENFRGQWLTRGSVKPPQVPEWDWAIINKS